QVDAMYDISAWNIPDLWGFDAIATHSTIDAEVNEVEQVDGAGELIGEGPYEITNSSMESIVLVNELIENNFSVYKASNGHYYVENGDRLEEIVQQTPGITLKTT